MGAKRPKMDQGALLHDVPAQINVLTSLLNQPSESNWLAICECLSKVCCDTHFITILGWVKLQLRKWPIMLNRPEPSAVTFAKPSQELAVRHLCVKVQEKDLYGHYIAKVCTHPLLQLPDGTPRVHLARAFTGGLDVGHKFLSIGEVGQADLRGGLIIEIGTLRLELRLEVEVKMKKGRVRDDQSTRQAAVTARGGVYIIARSPEDAVEQLVRYLRTLDMRLKEHHE